MTDVVVQVAGRDDSESGSIEVVDLDGHVEVNVRNDKTDVDLVLTLAEAAELVAALARVMAAAAGAEDDE